MTTPTWPILGDAEVLERVRSGTLPERWRTVILGGELRPLHGPGREVTVKRGPVPRGALVCVAHAGRIAWRRALEVRGDQVLLRGEMMPFPDGWLSGVIGGVEPDGLCARLAARLPGLWTSCGWGGALAFARLHSVPGLVRARITPPVGFETRGVVPADAAALARLPGRPNDLSGSDDLFGTEAPVKHLPDVGLVAPDGSLAGCLWLIEGDPWVLAGLRVAPAWRGRGGATVLVRAGLQAARARGAARVQAMVAARNFASLAACRKAGFAWTGKWWIHPDDALLAAERQWRVLETQLA